jgi:gliding motility-associated-like protein
MKCLMLQLCLIGAGILPVQARQETDHWYFGYHAGIHFVNGKPEPVTGSLAGWEGCSAVSDKNGNLLFYSDGMRVWNRQHAIMPNGAGLLGDTLSTQSVLITSWPGNDSLFYIFTVDKEGEANGVAYSLIDMRLDRGLGDINSTQKNIRLLAPACEKIAAVKRKNANDLWLIAHRFGTDELLVYGIDCRGLNAVPQVFHTGVVADRISNTIGYLKASPDGRWLALASFTSSAMVFDFDLHSGAISRPRTIYANENRSEGPYGLEFSPDGRFLYMSESYNNNGSGQYYVSQFDLEANAVDKSRVRIDSGYDNSAGALQAGPDGRIYIAYDGQPFLGAISEPAMKGIACNFQKEFLMLAPGTHAGVGLPASVAGYQKRLLPPDTTICEGVSFPVILDIPGHDLLWQDNSSSPSILIQNPGEYKIRVSNQYCTYKDSLYVNLYPKPSPKLENGLTICPGRQVLLNAGTEGDSYRWQDGSTLPVYTVTRPGTYSITVTNRCAAVSDTAVVATGACMLAIPNAFTPGKAANNMFRLLNGHLADHFTMLVYNRWGQLIFRSTDPLRGWDGSYGGIAQPAGTYIYQISYTVRATGQVEQHKGIVLLIR